MLRSRKWKVVLGLLTAVVLAGGFYTYHWYSGVKETFNVSMHQKVEAIDSSVTKEKIEKKDPLNVLLLGVDEREGDRGRSDSMMILSLNPGTQETKIISIPRDTRTVMEGNEPEAGRLDKINHAYAFGGTNMSVSTVERFLDIDLDHYVRVNMEGLAMLVDTVGGITVDNPLDWYDEGDYSEGYHYKEGEITLDGPQALGYVRMRYEDPNGDAGRNERQRQVIEAILEKGNQIGSVTKLNEFMSVLGNHVKTDIDLGGARDLFFHYRQASQQISNYQMTGRDAMIDGIYYLQVDPQEIDRVHHMIMN
ncbi:LCP family protein [Halobacillus locisalis]|uniref:LCP family glycopolymer transferase n=1 Tax=Halobacillus locisalis TaxID=220753 RepID=UPI001FE78CF4|nr:LCP family protein [Halobacillus locisalis]